MFPVLFSNEICFTYKESFTSPHKKRPLSRAFSFRSCLNSFQVFFPQVPLFKVEDAVAYSLGEGSVVGNDDHAHAFFFQFFHNLGEFVDGVAIEGRCGLVETEDVRLEHTGSHNGHPLLLAAGKVAGVFVFFVFDVQVF